MDALEAEPQKTSSRCSRYSNCPIWRRASATRRSNRGQRELAPPALGARYRALRTLAEATGAKLVIYFATALDRPFAELARDPHAVHEEVVDFVRQHDVPAYHLARELADADHLALRLDPACHFNAAGHKMLAERFHDIVLREMPFGDT